MSNVTRRQLLGFFGASAATTVIAPKVGEPLFGSDLSTAEAAGNAPKFYASAPSPFPTNLPG
jgi:uncharacterized protein